MRWTLDTMPIVVFAVCFLVVGLSSVLARGVIRAVMGQDCLERRYPVAWRFSLRAAVIFTIVMAGVVGLLRDTPVLALSAAVITAGVWLSLTWLIEIRRTLAERRTRAFESAIAAQKERHKEGQPADGRVD